MGRLTSLSGEPPHPALKPGHQAISHAERPHKSLLVTPVIQAKWRTLPPLGDKFCSLLIYFHQHICHQYLPILISAISRVADTNTDTDIANTNTDTDIADTDIQFANINIYRYQYISVSISVKYTDISVQP
jgi:hypothetical protein